MLHLDAPIGSEHQGPRAPSEYVGGNSVCRGLDQMEASMTCLQTQENIEQRRANSFEE